MNARIGPALLAGGVGPAARHDVRGGHDDGHPDDRGEHRLECAAAGVRIDAGQLLEPIQVRTPNASVGLFRYGRSAA